MFKISVFALILSFISFKLIECGIRIIADDKLLDDCLYAHNKYRERHENTKHLKLNKTATDYALTRIRTLAKLDSGRPVDNQRVVYGENFYWYYDNMKYHSCADAVDLWYKGRDRYDFNRPGFSEKSGGFSQVVWRGSQSLGCALVEDDTRKYFETYLVCSYFPAGNVDGQYPYNVMPLKSEHDRPNPGSGGNGGWSGTNEWSGDRPGGGDRPTSGGNRPVEKPISPGVWQVERPGTGGSGGSGGNSGNGVWNVERPTDIERPPPVRPPPNVRPPRPPAYPLVYLV